MPWITPDGEYYVGPGPVAEGAVEVPIRPSGRHVWQGGAWVLGPEPVPEALTPSQFWQQIEAGGLTSAADALIDSLPDPLQRIRARRVVEYRRADAQLIGMAAALGMDSEQIDEFFREAGAR